MKKTRVNLKENSYFIYLGYPLQNIGKLIIKGYGRKILILSDRNVHPLYGKTVRESLASKGKEIIEIVVSAGERVKNLNTVSNILKKCAENNMGRNDTILTLGGGVISDLGGFAAATYMRGIHFIAAPTTLLSQVDASIGGKTGVNLPLGKNLVGSFYQPSFVYMDHNTLLTLPSKEMKQGLAEIIKYGIIKSRKIFNLLETIPTREIKTVLSFLIEESVKIKKGIVEKDEKEKKGMREVLNFGHTLGHAIEISHLSKFSHGESVALGMAGETYLSWKKGFCKKDIYYKLKEVLKNHYLPFDFSTIAIDKIFDYLKYDKKARDGNLRFVLVQDIGKVKSGVIIKMEEVVKLLREMLRNEG